MPNFDTEFQIELQQVKNRLDEIRETVHEARRPIGGVEYCVTGKGLGPDRMPRKGWKPFAVGTEWGGYDQTTWFRMKATIPKAFKGRCVVALLRASAGSHSGSFDSLSAVGESLCYVNGKPRQGLDLNRDRVFLTQKAKGGESFDIALEAVPSTRFDALHLFRYADVAIFHQAVWDFYWDCAVPLAVYEELDRNYAPARQLFALIQRAVRMVDLQHKGEAAYHDSIAAAQRFLRKGLKTFETSYGMGKLILTGHSHIDTAWLWPLRETRRKCGRTFNTVLDLMDRYPEFHFSCSQPELYMFVKEHYPETWKRIKRRVKEGRWEPCGAGWVEQDSNVPSGESLVRQFLHGNRFYRREFGMTSPTAWLPDAFGYPWSLPQIMKKCQVDSFVTTKISWSLFTGFPYGMFQWQGIDGTRIFALMPPLNYNGNPTPHDCIEQWKQFKQKDRVEEIPFSIGWGDGGGGPTAEMIEQGKRLKNIVGVPKCEFGRTQDSLDRMKTQCDITKLPVYNDELYLELHRACQTTQARTKRNNRKSEILLHDTEFLSTLALLSGGSYDQEALWKAWRVVLTSQFHDILPGSSITEVYTQADQDYAALQTDLREVRGGALAHLAKGIDTRGTGTPVVIFNTLSWMREDVARVRVKLPRGAFHVTAPDGSVAPSQKIGPDEILFETLVPPLGYSVYHVTPGKAEAEGGLLKATPKLLENDFLRVRLDAFGRFTSVYDKVEQREALARGARGNVLQLFDDRPFAHDAWDIDHNFADERTWEPGKAESITVVEEGPVRAVVRVVRKTERSTITQDITLYACQPRVDVVTHVDWHEKRTLLKVAFPVEVLSPRATYHIQYGTIERSTHDNDERDRARFEVTGQHWADLSEGDYGVSLLNDCKYGYDVKGNVLRLSLLRAPVNPDPEADQGEHDMTWSLYPHGGDWRCGTVQQGFELNVPLLAVATEGTPGARPAADAFATVDAENVILDHVKKHEDSNAVILRLYEAYGQRGEVTLTFGETPKSVMECDMMEENDTPVKVKGNSVTLYCTPYEIRTLKVVF